MRVVDEDVIAKLTDAGLDVNDGFVDTTQAADSVEVTYPLPYVVLYSAIGNDHNPRLSAHNGRRSVFFSLTYVGETREQAKWAGEKARYALAGKRVAGVARSWLYTCDESQRVRRDDDAIRPDGSPLFYGVDNYSVSVRLDEEGIPA
jgi:hypothetical protein